MVPANFNTTCGYPNKYAQTPNLRCLVPWQILFSVYVHYNIAYYNPPLYYIPHKTDICLYTGCLQFLQHTKFWFCTFLLQTIFQVSFIYYSLCKHSYFCPLLWPSLTTTPGIVRKYSHQHTQQKDRHFHVDEENCRRTICRHWTRFLGKKWRQDWQWMYWTSYCWNCLQHCDTYATGYLYGGFHNIKEAERSFQEMGVAGWYVTSWHNSNQ